MCQVNYIENIRKQAKIFKTEWKEKKKDFNQTIKKVYRIPLSITSQKNTPTCQTFKQNRKIFQEKNKMTLHTDIIEKLIPVNGLKIGKVDFDRL